MISISILTEPQRCRARVDGILDQESLETMTDWLRVVKNMAPIAELDASELTCASPGVRSALLSLARSLGIELNLSGGWLSLEKEPADRSPTDVFAFS